MSTASFKGTKPRRSPRIPARIVVNSESSPREHEKFEDVAADIDLSCHRVYEFLEEFDYQDDVYACYLVYRSGRNYYVVAEISRSPEDTVKRIERFRSKKEVIDDFERFLSSVKDMLKDYIDTWSSLAREETNPSTKKDLEEDVEKLKKKLELIESIKPAEELKGI